MQLSALGVATPLAINLAAIGEAAAFEATDYKALVCVFLYGGNDYANTLVPYDATNYALYHAIRAGPCGEDQSGIALARADLAATALTPLDSALLTDNICNTPWRRSSPGSSPCSIPAGSPSCSTWGR